MSDGYCGAGYRWWLLPLIVIGTIVGIVVIGVVVTNFGYLPGPPWEGGVPVIWPLFPLGFFLFFVLLFIAFRWAWWGRGGWGRDYGRYGGQGPRAILRERYARGEITRERLQEMTRDLDELR